MREELLKFENVSYTLEQNPIVADINWTVRAGEHWAVIGPNGAGKSTLLKLIYGFLWPNSAGIIYRQGKCDADLGELRKSIGLVTGGLLKDIPATETALQTVLSGKYAMLGFWDQAEAGFRKSDGDEACRIMDVLGIGKFKNRTTKSLSHGENQKVLLARALMSKPYLILLDEPLDGLDPGAQESFLDTLNRYISHNNEPSFIYITHHIDEITPGFKKLLMIKNGKIMYKGDMAGGLSSERISELYDFPFRITLDHNRYRIIRI